MIERLNNKKLFNSFTIQILAIVLGVLCGISGINILQETGTFIANVFINMFKMVSLPIIALSIIVTLANYHVDKVMPSVWKRTIFYTIGTTLIAALTAYVLYQIIHPQTVNHIQSTGAVLSSISSGQGYLVYLQNMIPNNVIAPFINYQVPSVLVIGIAIGISMRYIPDPEAQKTIISFFKGLHGIFFTITRAIVKLLPIGVFGFITNVVVQFKHGVNISGLGRYLSVIVLANLIQGFIILPLWLKANGIKPFKTMKQMLPALSLAFFSKSSAGTLPVTINTVESRSGVDPKISRFVLPLCTTINMNGCAAFIFTTVIYLMQNHGVVFTPWTMLGWVLVATITALGNAGVPMGCFFLSMSLLSSMNVPITLMGVILPFYTVIDMLETSLNVWSDSCVTKVVDSKVIPITE